LPAAESEFALFRKRLKKAAGEENRNRLGEPLPDIRLNVLGAWRVTNNHDEILSRFSAALEPTEAVHA
jgi:hypothetical protein